MHITLFTIITLLLFSSPVFAQRDFTNVVINTIPVSGNIYMLEGSGGNIGVSVGEDGILLVDDQFAPLSDKIQKALTDIKDVPVKFVLNTHWHGDHTGGNEHFGASATIIAHDNVRKRLSEKQVIELFDSVKEPSPKGALPAVTFSKNLSVHFNGEEIKVIHFPNGHTDGDSVIFFTQSNVVHMGDHFFAGRFPFIDLSSGGNVKGYTANVAKLIKQIPNNAKIIPGHGELATKKELETFHQMLTKTTHIIQSKIAEKKSLEEIQKESLPDTWKSWGTGFINTESWIKIVYNSLTQ